jgi:hypothetical protein
MGMDLQTKFTLPPVDKRETLRYMGAREATAELNELLDACITETQSSFTPRLCFVEIPIRPNEGGVEFPFGKVRSQSLCRLLEGCDRAILLAATVGIEIDRRIAKYKSLSPARALCLQALGTERVEALCNEFCRALQAEAEAAGLSVTNRFSPGYGDLPLTLQADFFRLLDCPRQIGLTLNESLLMSPTKSVTAVVGLKGAKA